MIAQALQECVEQQSFRATFDQARAELAQDRVVEARVDQRQTQCVFPVDCVWDGYETIIEACSDAWNKLMQMPERIASLTK
jgi:hypothetical protein